MNIKTSSNLLCCKDIIQSLFDLNPLDIMLYKTLQTKGAQRADELAKQICKERSTVYRSLQRLASCGLVRKSTQTIQTGGYYHIYEPIELKNVKNHIERCLDKWYYHVKETLQHFEEELK